MNDEDFKLLIKITAGTFDRIRMELSALIYEENKDLFTKEQLIYYDANFRSSQPTRAYINQISEWPIEDIREDIRSIISIFKSSLKHNLI